MSVVTEHDLSLEITCIVAVQTKTAWADSLGASAFLIQHNRKSDYEFTWEDLVGGGGGSGSLPVGKNIQIIAELVLSVRTLGSQVQWFPLLIVSVSHPACSLARIPSVFSFFSPHHKVSHQDGGKKIRKGDLTERSLCLCFCLGAALCSKWTVNRRVTQLMSRFDCDPRYSHHCLRAT